MIVHALLEGEQVVDVRKGGLHEDGRHFAVHAERFWLYPTYLHQRPELLKAAYRPTLSQVLADAPGDDQIRVPGWAEVVWTARLTEPEELARLDSTFIWSGDYAASRLQWKRRDPLWVLALRVHVLDEPVEVPFDEAYAGCTSWVDLRGLPEDPATLASRPALSDTAFDSRLKGVRQSLAA